MNDGFNARVRSGDPNPDRPWRPRALDPVASNSTAYTGRTCGVALAFSATVAGDRTLLMRGPRGFRTARLKALASVSDATNRHRKNLRRPLPKGCPSGEPLG